MSANLRLSPALLGVLSEMQQIGALPAILSSIKEIQDYLFDGDYDNKPQECVKMMRMLQGLNFTERYVKQLIDAGLTNEEKGGCDEEE